MIGRKQTALLLGAFGVAVMMSTWGRISEWTEALLRREAIRHKKVVFWTASGSPELDLKTASLFMQRPEHRDIMVTPNFRETGGLQDMLFMSFLSGNPPDYMDANLSELRKYALMGGIRPMDDLVAAEGPDYFARSLLGAARVHRFRVNPEDRILRRENGTFAHPREAARLLGMDGRIIGSRGVAMPNTLTYNKRIFREAAAMFPDAGLLDAAGEPAPPTTWMELYEKARTITEYGRRAAEARGWRTPVCHGLVAQGQQQHDLMRGIRPLAARAGSMAFNFAGAARDAGDGRKTGCFEYHHPAFIAAFALLYRLRQDGLVMPGMEARHYEDVRTALANGQAGMVLDGWHAALIGAERVPWAAQDLGSAPVPRPYHDVNVATGWTAEKVEAEKRALHALLALDQVGIALAPGNRSPQTASGSVTFMTSLCRFPDATWEWMHFSERDEDLLRMNCRRGAVVLTRTAMAHIDDPDWFPYPFQKQVYRIIENECEMWPEAPVHGPVAAASEQEVFYKYFYQTAITDLAAILPRLTDEVRAYSDAANQDLARRVADGVTRPEEWTFPDWDPREAKVFFERQQGGLRDPASAHALAAARQELEAQARRQPALGLLDADGRLRTDLWRFDPPDSAWQLAWIPGLMVGLIAIAILVALTRRRGRPRATLRDLAAGIRAGRHGYAFVLPGMLAIFAFALYPSLYQFYLAVHKGDGLGVMQYVGFANFNRILNFRSPDFDAVFWMRVMPNTLIFMAAVTLGHMVLGLFLANLLNMPLRANHAYRLLFFIPLATSMATVSVILIGLLRGEDSGLNQLLAATGLQDLPYWLGLAAERGKAIDWLGDKTGLGTVIAVSIWHGLPFNIILLLAGLQSISPDLYEAATVDGANAWRRFAHITFPELLPILVVIAFQAFIGSARAFTQVFVLTEGGVNHSSELAATYIFKWGFMKPAGKEADLGYASALGIVYSVMLAGLTLTNVTIVARRWRQRLQAREGGVAAPESPA